MLRFSIGGAACCRAPCATFDSQPYCAAGAIKMLSIWVSKSNMLTDYYINRRDHHKEIFGLPQAPQKCKSNEINSKKRWGTSAALDI